MLVLSSPRSTAHRNYKEYSFAHLILSNTLYVNDINYIFVQFYYQTIPVVQFIIQLAYWHCFIFVKTVKRVVFVLLARVRTRVCVDRIKMTNHLEMCHAPAVPLRSHDCAAGRPPPLLYMLWLPACAQSECHAYRLVILIKWREGGSFKEN